MQPVNPSLRQWFRRARPLLMSDIVIAVERKLTGAIGYLHRAEGYRPARRRMHRSCYVLNHARVLCPPRPPIDVRS